MKRNSSMLSGSDAVLEHRSSSRDLPEIGTKLYEPSSSWLEGNRLRNALQERHSLISQPRIERDCALCVGKWEAEAKRVVVIKKKGKELETFGHHDTQCSNTYILNPEEALFLVESNSMVLLNENVEVSVEMCYALLLEGGENSCGLQQYKVFSHLSRLGYKLIRHKKPIFRERTQRANPATSSVKEVRSVYTTSKAQKKNCVGTSQDNVVVIEDSSSENDDDIVIVDVIKKTNNKDIIQIEDDDSCDSDIVILENEGLVELPLDNWSYVHRSKFLSSNQTDLNSVLRIDPLIISKTEVEILNEIPNIKGYKSWLYRADESLLPHGVWPFHYKYLIDLNEQKNWNNRGRGGFRGHRGFRGRGYYLQRQVSQMKNYTYSLMRMVSQLVGGQCLEVIPPPPSLFHGPNYRDPRGNRGRVSWGRISFGGRGSRNGNNASASELIVLSDDDDDDEQMEDIKPVVKSENSDEEDIKPKRLKLEVDVEPVCNDNSIIKTEPVTIKKEGQIKSENYFLDVKPDLSGTTEITLIKTENQIKMEIDPNEPRENEVSSDNTNNGRNISVEEATLSGSTNLAASDVSKNLINTTPLNLLNGIISTDNANDPSHSTEITQIHNGLLSSNVKESATCINVESEIPCESVHNNNNVSLEPMTQAKCNDTQNDEKKEGKIENPPSNSESPSDSLSVINDTVQSSTQVSGDSEIPNESVQDNVSQKPASQAKCNDTQNDEKKEGKIENPPSNSESPSDSLSIINDTVQSSTQVSGDSEIPNESVQDNVSQKPVSQAKCNDGLEGKKKEGELENPLSKSESPSNSKNICDPGSLMTSSLSENNVNLGKLPCNNKKNNVANLSNQNSSTNPLESNTVEQMESNDCHLDSGESSKLKEKSDKKRCWKELKECDPGVVCCTMDEENSQKDSIEVVEDESPSDDYLSSLIQPHHCTSLDDILKRLSIFKEFKSKVPLDGDKDLVVTVKYDVYLPTSTYYRNLPPSPDLRLIILRPGDPLPDANQMSLLKKIYNDNKNFLFAVVLPESIAYYLYDTVYLPVDNETL